MKKLLVVLALILLAVLPLFAQDVKPEISWTGSYIGRWHFDQPTVGDFSIAMYQNWLINTFTVKAQNYGAVVTTYFDWKTQVTGFAGDPYGAVYIDQVYGWATLFNGFLTITMGQGLVANYAPVPLASYTILNGDLGAGLNQHDYDWNYWSGTWVQIMPVNGLNIGLYLVDTALVTFENYLNGGGIEFAAKYDIDKIGTVAAGYTPIDNAGTNESELFASFVFQGVENLVAQAKFESISNVAVPTVISASISYKFAFGLTFAQDVEMFMPEVGDSYFELVSFLRYNTDFGRIALHFRYNTSTELYQGVLEARFDTGDITNRFRFYLYDPNDVAAAKDFRIRYDFIINF